MVDDQDLARKIASFPDWHYNFDLRGQQTLPGGDKAGSRVEHVIDPVIAHFGGSLAGKRVLDLGCNAGYFSLKAIEAGCDFVLGVDGRQMHIDQANLVFETKEVDSDRYAFACGNILDFDYSTAAPFDLVLCLGVLYHVNKPISLFETIDRINTDMLVIDTKISPLPGSVVDLRRESLAGFKNAVDYDLVMVPTAQAVIDMVQLFGYRVEMLGRPAKGAIGMKKYEVGTMKAFICAKQSDLEKSSAFAFQSMSELLKDQARGEELRNRRHRPRSRLRSLVRRLYRRSPKG